MPAKKKKRPAVAVSAAAAPVVVNASASADLLKQIDCFERLQTEVGNQVAALRLKQAAIEDEFFKDACALAALTAPNALVQRVQTLESASAASASQLAVLERFGLLVERRYAVFRSGKCELLAEAYKRRIEELSARHVKEQAEADAVREEIVRLKSRISECGKLAREQAKLVVKTR